MAQKTGLLILLATLGFQGAHAQEKAATPVQPAPSATAAPSAIPAKPAPSATATPSATPTKPAPPPTQSVVPPAKGAAFARKLENLTPLQRKRFQENLERWKKMPKAQQDDLLREAQFLRERILKEINAAIEETGLKLDDQQRQVFTYRYAEERRTIEQKLRESVEEKRREAIAELIRELSAEFQPIPPDASWSHQP